MIRDGLVVDFSLSQAGFGGLSSSFYYPYILLQVPAGLLVVRHGARKILLVGIVLCTLACFVTAFSRELVWVETARLLMGFGSAPTFVCTMALATRWFPQRMLAILVALVETLGMLGPGARARDSRLDRGNRRLENGSDGLRLVWVVAFPHDPSLCQEFSRNRGSRRHGESPPFVMEAGQAPPLQGIGLVALVGGMIYSAGLALAMLWRVSFFEQHMRLAEASFCASFFSWGIVVGLPAFGWASGRLAGPIPLLAFGAVMTGASVALILYGPQSYFVFSLRMFLCGIANDHTLSRLWSSDPSFHASTRARRSALPIWPSWRWEASSSSL